MVFPLPRLGFMATAMVPLTAPGLAGAATITDGSRAVTEVLAVRENQTQGQEIRLRRRHRVVLTAKCERRFGTNSR